MGASSTPATGAADDRTPAPDLRTLREAADYAVEKIRTVAPSVTDFPVWDYRAPQQPHDIKDASAGAITACGLLDLSAARRPPRDASR